MAIKVFPITVTLAILLNSGVIAMAQIPVPPPAPVGQLLPSGDLDQMLQPIALYPDPLIGQILAAASLPVEIVQADRYVTSGGAPNLIDQQPWDPSVQALARYPAVLKWMDDNLNWTTSVGQAFLAQQQDVMDSVQRLRDQAQSLGNLQSTPQENVVTDNGEIEILPADPQVIYVPVYQPEVVYYQRWYSGSPFISFGNGYAVGAWLDLDFDWRNHHLMEWGRDHPRPGDWWTRRPAQRIGAGMPHASTWRPQNRPNVIARSGDRGFNTAPARPAPMARAGNGVAPSRQPAPAVLPHTAPAPKARPAQGALIGVHSSRQTQQFTNRGQQSRQVAPKPAAPKPAPPAARPAQPAKAAPPSRPAGGKEKR